MGEWLTTSMVVLMLLVLLGIVFLVILLKKKREGMQVETDYRTLFIMGIIFSGAGIVMASSTDNPGLGGIALLGVVYMITGIANRDKWKDNGVE